MMVPKYLTPPFPTVWFLPRVRISLSSSAYYLPHTQHLFLTRKRRPSSGTRPTTIQAKLHAVWRAREDERLVAIARGDPNPPPAEADPSAQREIGLLSLLKFLIYLTIGSLLAGKFVTGEWDWGS